METHVIPLLIQTALGQRPSFTIYGDSWPTPDGTCVRDFVSTRDLAEAHLLALTKVEPGMLTRYNLGSGRPTSVRALLDACGRLSVAPVPHAVSAPRPGDPPVLIADISLARAGLGWTPRWSDIGDILATAWAWHSRPSRYAEPLAKAS